MNNTTRVLMLLTMMLVALGMSLAQGRRFGAEKIQVLTPPLTNDFENKPFQGWTRSDFDGDSVGWKHVPVAHSGFGCARADSNHNGTPSNDWLVSPQRTINAGDTLVFWARRSGSGKKFLQVRVSTTTPDSGSFGLPILTLDSTLSTSFTKFKVGLPNFAGQAVYIAFVSNIVVPSGSFFLDDFYVGGQSSPVFVRNLLAGAEINAQKQFVSNAIYAFGLPEPTISINNGPAGAILQASDNTVAWTPPAGSFGFIPFSFHASNSVGSADTVDSLDVRTVLLHNVNDILASVSDNGELGTISLNGSQGFVFKGKEELALGGLVVGASTSQVSTGSVFTHGSSFLTKSPLVQIAPLRGIDQQFRGVYADDLAAGGPLGITVTQN
ncbi:MAG TPA: choice-of-anchor J domain-containing protein, partial [Bacteroidota bacterium]